MNILILGAASFIGTNLALELAKNEKNSITLVDKKEEFFNDILKSEFTNISIVESQLDFNENFDKLLENQDIVYHLVSTVVPSTSNQHITQDIEANVLFSSNLFYSCVKNNIDKVVFISSGGTVYGKEGDCPLSEETPTHPITSYGLQKVMIEQLLFLYNYMYGLEYKIIRLANPYGPYQRPNGVLGAITTFTYKALKNEPISVYGDGSVIRDYIYIDDAIRAIIKISNFDSDYNIFNLGSGEGKSINEIIEIIEEVLNVNLNVNYKAGRKVDVPINFLDMSRYNTIFGKLERCSLKEGISRTAKFLSENY